MSVVARPAERVRPAVMTRANTANDSDDDDDGGGEQASKRACVRARRRDAAVVVVVVVVARLALWVVSVFRTRRRDPRR